MARKAWQIVREYWRQSEAVCDDHDIRRLLIAAVKEARGDEHEPLTIILDEWELQSQLKESERLAREQKLTNWRHERGRELRKTMQCNCDLDRWEPERTTGHSHVCRIHKAVMSASPPAP